MKGTINARSTKMLLEFGGVRLGEGDLEQTHVAGRDHLRHLLAIMLVLWILPVLSLLLPAMQVRLERGLCVQEIIHVILRPDQILHAQLMSLLFRLPAPGNKEYLLVYHALK